MKHDWQPVELTGEDNPLGFRWVCIRCGSVSGQKDEPAADAELWHKSGALNCDDVMVRNVMES